MSAPIIEMMHELDSRSSDGLTVTLLWREDDNSVWLEILADAGDCEIFAVPNSEAANAFQHPFVYAAANSHGHGITV